MISSEGLAAEPCRLVRAAHAAGRLGSTWLLVGESGVGQRDFARWMVALAWCPGATPPCGSCSACRRVLAGEHGDLVLVERGAAADPQGLGSAHEITVGQVREQVLASLAVRALEGRGRAVIIDGAEDLNEEAQNTLLKVLEEPPSGSLIILVTAREDLLLETVLSRCQVLALPALDPVAMAHAAAGHPAALVALARGRPGLLLPLAGVDAPRLLGTWDGLLAGRVSAPAFAQEVQAALVAPGAEGGPPGDPGVVLDLFHQRLRDLALSHAGGTDPGPTGGIPDDLRRLPNDALFSLESALLVAHADLRRHVPAGVLWLALGLAAEVARMGVG